MNILELELETNHALEELSVFYNNLLLRLPVDQTKQHLKLQIGTSQLTFKFVESAKSARYHFAINIPRNQFKEAKKWLSKQVPLIQDNDGRNVFHSEEWNADNIYFYDPAGNILELIARHTLDNDSEIPFSSQSLLNISEIGIATNDVAAQVTTIQNHIDVKPYKSGSKEFTPVGDEHGLFIVVKQGRTWFPDTDIPAECLSLVAIVKQHGHTAKLSFF